MIERQPTLLVIPGQRSKKSFLSKGIDISKISRKHSTKNEVASQMHPKINKSEPQHGFLTGSNSSSTAFSPLAPLSSGNDMYNDVLSGASMSASQHNNWMDSKTNGQPAQLKIMPEDDKNNQQQSLQSGNNSSSTSFSPLIHLEQEHDISLAVTTNGKLEVEKEKVIERYYQNKGQSISFEKEMLIEIPSRFNRFDSEPLRSSTGLNSQLPHINTADTALNAELIPPILISPDKIDDQEDISDISDMYQFVGEMRESDQKEHYQIFRDLPIISEEGNDHCSIKNFEESYLNCHCLPPLYGFASLRNERNAVIQNKLSMVDMYRKYAEANEMDIEEDPSIGKQKPRDINKYALCCGSKQERRSERGEDNETSHYNCTPIRHRVSFYSNGEDGGPATCQEAAISNDDSLSGRCNIGKVNIYPRPILKRIGKWSSIRQKDVYYVSNTIPDDKPFFDSESEEKSEIYSNCDANTNKNRSADVANESDNKSKYPQNILKHKGKWSSISEKKIYIPSKIAHKDIPLIDNQSDNVVSEVYSSSVIENELKSDKTKQDATSLRKNTDLIKIMKNKRLTSKRAGIIVPTKNETCEKLSKSFFFGKRTIPKGRKVIDYSRTAMQDAKVKASSAEDNQKDGEDPSITSFSVQDKYLRFKLLLCAKGIRSDSPWEFVISKCSIDPIWSVYNTNAERRQAFTVYQAELDRDELQTLREWKSRKSYRRHLN